ncbi:calcium-dependent protein kinase 20-like [Cynara cardunculus var. scolymus]|uniref:calcium-dependent protein kinase 20-like n=1 Tax=Cynara cardunculus var. scolymus TaxID=59895 RepID=UPI000D62AFF2|nr:calcium-dependent protein kinase 20-like [Cynara cardunculus var. scolymus]
MGNNCVGPNMGRTGFLQSVTAAVWKNRPAENTLPPPDSSNQNKNNTNNNNANENKTDDPSSKGSEKPRSVQNTPPDTVKMSGQEAAKPAEKAKAAEAKGQEKPKAANNFKRMASAGLQANSVLQRKTGNLKDVYSVGKKLGQGQFGTTFLCVEKETGKEFACKSIAKRKLTTKEDVEDVRREIQIMHHLAGHPHVISIVGAYEDAVAVHVIMELCAGGELFDRIIQRGHYTEKKAAELARTIVGVVESCHSLGVMHRDLKPENFLFINEQEEAPLKTIDFGLSMFFKPGEMFTDMVGSPYYVAPEVLRKFYSQECDIWSAGVIIYILLSGVPPFWDETEQGIFEQVLKGDLDFASEPWPSISESAKDLVRRMLVRDPKRRLTAPEVLRHPWVQADGVAPDKPLDSAVLSRLKQFSAMNKIKKIAIRVIAENLSEEEIAGLKEMFKMIDADGSGQITLEELKKGLEKVGADLKDSEIVRLMEAADIDNSGTIDYGEFVAAMLHINKIHKEDHMYAAFSYFDKDGSGYITADELQQACEQFGLGDIHLDEVMRDIDKDNDGRIDYSEFVAMMKEGEFGKHTKSIRLR